MRDPSSARARLGQHFLRDPAILDRIVDALEPAPDDVVLEIGPGEGTLTRRLARRVGHVVAIEKDRELADRLRGAGSGERYAPLPANVTVIEGDALELDWHQNFPLTPHSSPLTFKVSGNIPYYITSPLLEKALTPPEPAVIVFLVQKEVAERVTAGPGSKAYGALSVGLQVVCRVESLFTVRAGAFQPPPAVHSAVIRLRPLAVPALTTPERPGFRAFVVGLFGQRRKQLARSLRDVAGLERDPVARLLAAVGIPPTARAETIPPAQLVALYRAVMREAR